MYKVTAILHIHANFSGCSSDDVWLEKDFELPFPPSRDITIYLPPPMCDCRDCQSYGMDELSIHPEEIIWIRNEDRFKVYVESDKQLYNKALNERKMLLLDTKDQEEFNRLLYKIVWDYRHMGWNLR